MEGYVGRLVLVTSTRRRLLDAYRFHGFRPVDDLRGVFGDPHARVVTLVRRSKKRSAGRADDSIPAGTIARFGALAIWQPAICGSSWSSRCGASLSLCGCLSRRRATRRSTARNRVSSSACVSRRARIRASAFSRTSLRRSDATQDLRVPILAHDQSPARGILPMAPEHRFRAFTALPEALPRCSPRSRAPSTPCPTATTRTTTTSASPAAGAEELGIAA
jgi:hypothetical protein